VNRASGLEFRAYTADLEAAVKAFNARLRVGGETHAKFRESHVLRFPYAPARSVFQQAYVLTRDGVVHGAYMLRHQQCAIKGVMHQVACGPQMPISEGIIDPRYAVAGVSLLRHALRLLVWRLGSF
jgi:hypothetical protein